MFGLGSSDPYVVINAVFTLLFAACFGYQLVYILISAFRRAPGFAPAEPGRYAVLVCARNEEVVIARLVGSVREQNYPVELVDLYVLADNCTDDTAKVARAAGAQVFERHNSSHVGKGYALDYLIGQISNGGQSWAYDGYIILDADNILDQNFISEMNNALQSGQSIVTSYRDSKNFADNWLSAGYSLWWLRESRYFNGARSRLGLSAQVWGTGFAIRGDLLEELGGWHFYTLAEDVEFSFAMIVSGRRIGYNPNAIIYDEQPTRLKQAWDQRVRWIKGYFQAYRLYDLKMLRCLLKTGNFACYDLLLNTLIGPLVTLAAFISFAASAITQALLGLPAWEPLFYFCQYVVGCYLMFFIVGCITAFSEHGRIYASRSKIICYAFSFPLFFFIMMPMILYIPFDKRGWPHIEHTHAIGVDDVKEAVRSGRPPGTDATPDDKRSD
ncbi:MAG: glycosyltransferase [Coriobacteriales bacterium]|jgi:cellulose synthase/poly-beta-1,6-N-acetylglucosamine synthase-like glycosyltransferase|nr:glycosyltransferase [Coriobacteriales bacterium]